MGKVTDKISDIRKEVEREVKDFKHSIHPEVNNLCRRFRNWRDDALLELYEKLGAELLKRGLLDKDAGEA